MKKLTIYRHGEYDKRLHLLPQSAYELFSQAKKLKDELGPVEAIYVSPVIRALQSAAVIQLVMQAETFIPCFAKTFIWGRVLRFRLRLGMTFLRPTGVKLLRL